jgi:glycosyltransferase involved in cell wall biosynthesis
MAKILHICGLDSFVSSFEPLLTQLMKQGHTVHCACTDTGLFEELSSRGLTMIHMPVVRKIQAPSNAATIYKLFRLMKKEKYDIVHVHNPIASVLGRLAAKLAGIPHVIYTSHGFYFHEHSSKGQYLLYYGLEKLMSRLFTDWLLLVSREDYQTALDKRFLAPEQIVHISNGVDVKQRFNPACLNQNEVGQLRESWGIKEQDLVICFVGRLIREKGIVELQEAFRRLSASHSNLWLLLVGGVCESERDHFFDKEGGLGADSRMIATGFRKDTPELLCMSDLFVLPSHREGMPLSILEAMSMGKPVVATNIRGCREEVIDGYNGYLVEPRNAEALAESLAKLIEDTENRACFAKRSRVLAEERFHIDDVLVQQLLIYQEILSGTSPRILTAPQAYHS